MSMRIVLVVVGILAALPLYSQVPNGQRARLDLLDYGDRFYGEAYVLPTTRPDSATVVIFFRMANDFMTFTKVTDRNDVGGNFKAEMRLSIEARDSMGVIRQRLQWKESVYCNYFEQTNSKNDFHYGWARIAIAPGSFTVGLEIVSTKESGQKKLRLPTVTFDPDASNRQLAPPMFGVPVDGPQGDIVRPFISGGNVLFQQRDAMMLLLVNDAKAQMYDYAIRQLPLESRDIRYWEISDVLGEVRSEPGKVPMISDRSTNDAPYVEVVDKTESSAASTTPSKVALLRVPIPVSGLVPGRYRITLVGERDHDTIDVLFQVFWEMMPLSLRNVSYAIEIARYVLTDEQMDSIDAGNDRERRSNIMAFWRRLDGTPTTTYNERMSEYYRRVDEAFFEFSTIQEPDGARTERGKIYILHGPPTKVEKKLSPGDKTQEVWTYANVVRKVFHFDVGDDGVYKLRSIEDL